MKNQKVVPTYTNTAKKIAQASWNACKTKKVRDKRTKVVKKSFDEFSDKMQKQTLYMFMVLKCGYGVHSPEFKKAKQGFDELINVVERGCATANAWLEIANASN